MKFRKVNYKKQLFDSSTPVNHSYIRLQEKNSFQKVNITEKQCKDSVRFFSRLYKN